MTSSQAYADRNVEFRAIVVLYVGCLLIGQMLKPRLGGIPITLIDLLIAGTFPLIVYRMRARLGVYAGIVLFLLPNVLFGLAYLTHGDIDPAGLMVGLYSCYRFLFPLLIVFCYARRIGTDDRAFCLRVLLAGLGFHIVFGILQAATLPNFALQYGPKDLPWDYQENRLVSTFLDPNLVSSLFYGALLALLCHVASAGMPLQRHFVVIMAGAALAAALTASRGGALGFILAFGALVLETSDLSLRKKLKWMFIGTVAAVAVLAAFIAFFGMEFIERTNRFGASNVSVGARLVNLMTLLEVFMEAPVFGRGFNFLPYLPGVEFVMVSGNYSDGGLLYLMASVGLFGLLALTAVVYGAATSFARPRLFLYPAAMLVLQSMTTASMYYPLLTIFVVLFALGLDGYPRGAGHRWLSSQKSGSQAAVASA
jgi:hypothetical protein